MAYGLEVRRSVQLSYGGKEEQSDPHESRAHDQAMCCDLKDAGKMMQNETPAGQDLEGQTCRSSVGAPGIEPGSRD